MNVFKLREYWRYRRAAIGRHGVHSPFVYRFIEEALRPPANRFKAGPAFESATGEVWNLDVLLRRVVQYFRFSEIVVPSSGGLHPHIFRAAHNKPDGNQLQFHGRLYDWQDLPHNQWIENLHKAGPADIVAVRDVHRSAACAAAWQALCLQPDVTLSIDLYRLGLLFFSKDFKEQQHFVLKHPA